MKKILLSAFVVLTFFVYVFRERVMSSDDEVNVVAPKSSQDIIQPSPSDITQSASPPPTDIPKKSPVNQMMGGNQMMVNKYKDGEFTGNVADAYYGPMQVKAIISGGKITDILFLQYPSDRRTSIEINTQAMPYLKQEAIQAQSAQVDIVSGATQSSKGFRDTLQSALDKARNS